MSTTKPAYQLLYPKDIYNVIPREVIDFIHDEIQSDILSVDRESGLGIFIRDHLVIKEETDMSIAVVAEWHTTDYIRKPSFLKYHLYKGEIPDELLDDINLISEKTDNPVWKK